MKKLFNILLSIPLTLFGQNLINSDSLYFMDGKVEGVEIIEIDDDNVKYKYKGEPFAISTKLKKISKILTANGRLIIIENTQIRKTVFSVEDWEKVEITNLDSDVEDLNRIANVTGRAKGMTTLSSSAKIQNRAMNKMRMQAAFYGCDVIYMLNQTNTDSRMGNKYSAGQTAGSTISGTSYSVNRPGLDSIIDGDYFLYKAYKLGINDMAYKDFPLHNLNRIIHIDRNNFIKNDNYFMYPYQINTNESLQPRIQNAESEVNLLSASAEEVVFLLIVSSPGGKIDYYNLFFTKEIPSEISVEDYKQDAQIEDYKVLIKDSQQITFHNIKAVFSLKEEVSVLYEDPASNITYNSDVVITKIAHNRVEFFDLKRKTSVTCYLSYIKMIGKKED